MISFNRALKRMIGNLVVHLKPATRFSTVLACVVISLLDFLSYCMPTCSSVASVSRPKKSLWAILSHPCAIAFPRTEKAYFYYGTFVLKYMMTLETYLCCPTATNRWTVSPHLTNPITTLRTVYIAGYPRLKCGIALGTHFVYECLSLLSSCFSSTIRRTDLPSIPRCSMIPAIRPEFCATDIANFSFFRQSIMRCSHIFIIA